MHGIELKTVCMVPFTYSICLVAEKMYVKIENEFFFLPINRHLCPTKGFSFILKYIELGGII